MRYADDPNYGCTGCVLWFMFWGSLLWIVTQVLT